MQNSRFCLFSSLSIAILLCTLNIKAQNPAQIRVMFYNVENLFDTYDDSLKRDEAFTPYGSNRWSKWRYQDKLQKIAKNIIAIGEWENVDIVGLAEIENRYVLEQLLSETPLVNIGYEILHQESKDLRGIDVALLYLKDKLELLEWEALEVIFEAENSRPTRDILYAKFLVLPKDTLHVFVNHWPSRYGGQVATEPKRAAAAKCIRNKMTEIQKRDALANILITGDLNDEPEDISIKEVLQAKKYAEEADSMGLINLCANLGWNIGTHKYQGRWGVLDHIIVSKALLDGYGNLQVKSRLAQVFSANWLLEDDLSQQGKMPFRTYLGPRYHGGFSDHLPIFIDISIKSKLKD